MLAKKALCLTISVLIILNLCGCGLFAFQTDELLSPPSLTGELAPIAEAVKASTDGTYNLEYPSRGDYRSAVVQEDIDGDGIPEAFAFYSVTEDNATVMYVNAIVNDNGTWHSAARQKITAGGVDKLDFCDLDGDGVDEILVGWEIYGTSEMQLAVYTLGKDTLTQRMLQKYAHFVACDLDEDGKNEILLVKTDFTQQINTASLFEFSENGVTEIAFCELDSAAKTVNEPVVATLSTGKAAVYIDEIKGVGAVTEVLFTEKGKLVNPLFQADTRQTLSTLRPAVFSVRDINGDGILEIPVQENVPSVSNSGINEKLYLTAWCSFNGEALTKQITALVNTDDGYYYTLPAKWLGNIAVLKDTDSNLREFYKYNPEDMTVGESIVYIKTVDTEDWKNGKYKADGVYEIMNNGEKTFICGISNKAEKEGLTVDEIKSNFKLYE